MGRQQHLERLALGRSAFEDAPERPQSVDGATTEGEQQIQQYNNKGRPINLASETRNAEMRNAFNTVYSLAGVVESIEETERAAEKEITRKQEDRRAMLDVEDLYGFYLEQGLAVLGPLVKWWADILTKQYQIGLLDCSAPFALTLRARGRPAVSGGLRGVYAAGFAGLTSGTTVALANGLATYAIDELTQRLSEAIWQRFKGSWTLKPFIYGLVFFRATLRLGSAMLLFPFLYWSEAQQLGLAPPLAFWPPLRSLLPWHPTSAHAFGWRPLVDVPFLGRLTSPAALLLAYHLLVEQYAGGDEVRIHAEVEIYHTHGADTVVMKEKPRPHNPLSWLHYYAEKATHRILRWCAWDIVSINTDSVEYDEDVTLRPSPAGHEIATKHRSTALARLPAHVLASSIHGALTSAITLPLHSTVLRVLAGSYLASPLPKTTQAFAAAPWLYAPFSGPFSAWFRSTGPPTDSLAHVGAYASKVGLGFGIQIALDVLLFGGSYALARSRGRRHFGWAHS